MPSSLHVSSLSLDSGDLLRSLLQLPSIRPTGTPCLRPECGAFRFRVRMPFVSHLQMLQCPLANIFFFLFSFFLFIYYFYFILFFCLFFFFYFFFYLHIFFFNFFIIYLFFFIFFVYFSFFCLFLFLFFYFFFTRQSWPFKLESRWHAARYIGSTFQWNV